MEGHDSPCPEGTRHIQDAEGSAEPQNYGSSGREMRVSISLVVISVLFFLYQFICIMVIKHISKPDSLQCKSNETEKTK